MKTFPKISIVTASYNLGKFLEETILSILNQNYPNLEYIIIDGGSSDNSIDIIKKYQSRLAYWISEPDQGLYHALQKGFEKSTGEIMGYLNADDILHQKSLFILADIFSKHPHVKWLQAHNTIIDEQSRIIHQGAPYNYTKYHFYLRDHLKNGQIRPFGTIQQESTYWKRDLWAKAGGYIGQQCKLAGDFELWMRFFRYEPLYLTTALVGAFRTRSGQLSDVQLNNYWAEAEQILKQELKRLSYEEVNALKYIRLYRKFINKIPWIRTKALFNHKYTDLLRARFVYPNF